MLAGWLDKHLGQWWVCIALFAISLTLFTWVVPAGVASVTGNRQLAPKILDEYVMTWTPDEARQFYQSIGQSGREEYQRYYWHLDFWFPVLSLTLFYMSLLSLAYPRESRFARLNLSPLLLWLADGAENINHFVMAERYPSLPTLSLEVGPNFTFVKWVLIFAIPLIALIGFASQRLSHVQTRRGSR